MAKQSTRVQKKSSTKSGQKKKKAGRANKDLENLGLGKQQTEYPTTYSPDVLESFPNQHPKSDA